MHQSGASGKATPRRMRPHRILLVHPGIYDDLNPSLFPPWGALCVASTIREAGFEVEVADLNGAAIPEAIQRLVSDYEPDVIGITGKLGLAARRLRAVVDTIRNADNHIQVAVGGP